MKASCGFCTEYGDNLNRAPSNTASNAFATNWELPFHDKLDFTIFDDTESECKIRIAFAQKYYQSLDIGDEKDKDN